MCVKASDWAYLICFQHFLFYISNTDYMKVIQQIWAYNMNCTTFKVKDFGELINTRAPAWLTERVKTPCSSQLNYVLRNM